MNVWAQCVFNPHMRAIAAMVTHKPYPVIFLTSLLHSLPIIAPPSLLLPSHISLVVEMFQQKRTLPLVLWRQAMGGSVRTELCAGLGGTGPSMASPTSTTSPSPCWRCSSASPWRAGRMCCTGYVDGALRGWVCGRRPVWTSHLPTLSLRVHAWPHTCTHKLRGDWWMSLICSSAFLRNKA